MVSEEDVGDSSESYVYKYLSYYTALILPWENLFVVAIPEATCLHFIVGIFLFVAAIAILAGLPCSSAHPPCYFLCLYTLYPCSSS